MGFFEKIPTVLLGWRNVFLSAAHPSSKTAPVLAEKGVEKLVNFGCFCVGVFPQKSPRSFRKAGCWWPTISVGTAFRPGPPLWLSSAWPNFASAKLAEFNST